MNTKNNILTILNSRGFERVVPTQTLLETMQMSMRRFLKIVNNTGSQMTVAEATGFANWLSVTVEELTTD